MQGKWQRVWWWLAGSIWLAGGMLWAAEEPKPIVLWPEGAPGALGKEEADIPTLTAYLASADRATGAAIIICPGGGYHHLSPAHGEPVARWLNSIGVAGFVLKYRHLRYKHPAPLQDVQRAIRLVRTRAPEWRLDAKRIGVMGFSAGGHLASMAGVHFDAGRPDAEDPIERTSSRPDFLVLAVPVITMRPPKAHAGSVKNLLGENPSPEWVAFCSTDEQVRPDTPPTFIVSSWSDEVVPVENSLRFAMALRQAGVPCEMHLYQQGPHNFLLAKGQLRQVLDSWWDRLADWLRLQGHAASCPAGPAPTWDYSQPKK
jgi:acetyl esterase/lipase